VSHGDKDEVEALLQNVSPNFHVTVKGHEKELSPLQIAAILGDLGMVNLLITYGARVDCCGWGEDTPLTLAISHGHAVVALALIRRGANIVLADGQERTPLHHAARQNLYAVVQVLIHNSADLNAYDRAGRTPLLDAIRRSDREIQPDDTNVLRVLLQRNRHGTAADPTLGTVSEHYTPIHDAAARGYVQDLEVMLTASAQPGLSGANLILDSADRTPLWFAARNGHADAVKLLLRLGADMQLNRPTRDPDYPTAVWAMAAASSDPAASPDEGISTLLACLLATIANPNTQHPTTRQTLLHHACLTNNHPLVCLLLSHNANPLLTDSNGQQPLHYAARQGNEPILTTVLTCTTPEPIDINAQDHSGTNPLMLAAEEGHDFLLPLLIHKYHADPHIRNNAGSTAFHLACARGQITCAAILLGYGADIDAQNGKGNTALHLAARNGEVEMVAWLVRMGARADVGVPTGSREGGGG
jgi:ankyrin repeat protein